jgi:hypothetical protein
MTANTHLRTGLCDLDHHVLAGEENTDKWHARKRDLQYTFPMDVPMVPSLTLIITADGEFFLLCDFSLSETIRYGRLEFIADCFGGLSLSPRRDSSDAATMGSTRSRPPSPLQAMTRDSTKELHTASDRDGGLNVPSPRRHDIGASLTPAITMSWPENTPTTQSMMMIPPRSDTDLPYEPRRIHQEGK